MKKSLLSLFLMLFLMSPIAVSARSYLGTELPLVGKTQLPQNMQAVVLGYVYSKVARDAKGCRNIMLSDTKVVKEKEDVVYNRNGREIGGTWSEEWTINACESVFVVPVNFTTTGHGVKYDIQNIKNK